MKKILYVQHAGGLGGAPKSLAYIIENLDKSHYIPTVINLFDGPANILFKEAGAKVIVTKNIYGFHGTTVSGINLRILFRNYTSIIPTYIKAKNLISKIKPDIIHLNTTCLFIFAIAAKSLDKNIKVICHVREPILRGFWGFPLRFFNKLFCDRFISICEYDNMSLNPPKFKSHVIYNNINLNEFKPAQTNLREELNIPSEAILIVFVARINKTNGAFSFIEIAKSFEDKNYYFLLFGKQDGDEIPKRIQNLLNNKIRIYDFSKDVKRIYQEADIHICNFHKPHFSRSIIEASACGTPSIGPKIGGVDELIDHNQTGLLFNNSNELRKYISILANSENKRIKMGNKAREKAERLFNMRINNKKLFEVYNNLN